MYDAVALGELLIDFVEQGTNSAGYPVMAANPGGAPGNYLAALSRYGAKTAFLGKVGDDAFGQLLIDAMADAGVDTRAIIRDKAVFTTMAFVTLDAQGDRSFSFARKPGADTQLRFDELPLSLIDEAKSFHFGTASLTDEPARSATYRAVAYAKSRGKLITFDPNLRPSLWRDKVQAKKETFWGLAQADIVKISDEDLAFLWDCSPQGAAVYLREEYGVSLTMVTMGAKGCYLHSGLAEYTARCPAVKPIDTTGAGDIFGGSAMSRLLRMNKTPAQLTARDLEQIARFAVTAASLSTQTQGGIPSIPSERSVLARMAQG